MSLRHFDRSNGASMAQRVLRHYYRRLTKNQWRKECAIRFFQWSANGAMALCSQSNSHTAAGGRFRLF
jgi:hypothetical protein